MPVYPSHTKKDARMRALLTKTDFTHYYECPVRLWLERKRPDAIPEDPGLEALFAMGREVDMLARKLFPGGIEVKEFGARGWAETQRLLKKGTWAIFQPTVIAKEIMCRPDILTFNEDEAAWDIREVKMAVGENDTRIADIAFQRLCLEEAGIPVARTYLVHVNREFVRHGAIDSQAFFIQDDVTDAVAEVLPEISIGIAAAKVVLARNLTPDPELLSMCKNPASCDYAKYYCAAFPDIYKMADRLPAENLRVMLERGVLDAKKLKPAVVEASGYRILEPFEDKKGIREELANLRYPLYFLDYETTGGAIPAFDGYRPYQATPFQYSLFIQESPSAPLEHVEFLARKFADPVPELAAHLHKHIGPKGSVIVWNMGFEGKCNELMAEHLPDMASFLHSVNDRLFDLMLIFKYKRQLFVREEFHRSASLKQVLPVVCPELAYTDLAIQEGNTASVSWLDLTGNTMSPAEMDKLAADMLAYCKRDTEAMVVLLDRVRRAAK